MWNGCMYWVGRSIGGGDGTVECRIVLEIEELGTEVNSSELLRDSSS